MKAWSLLPRARRLEFAGLLAVGLAVTAGQALLPSVFLKALFDRCIASRDLRAFFLLLAAYLAATTLWRLMSYRHGLRTARLKQAVSRDLSLRALGKYYRLPYAETALLAPAYWASRVYDEPREASHGAVDLGFDLAAYAATLLGSGALLVAVSWRAAVLLALCAPVLVLLSRSCAASIRTRTGAEKETEGALRGYLAKAVQAYRVARLFELRGAAAEGLASRTDAVDAQAYERLKTSGLHDAGTGMLMSCLEIVVLVACGYEMLEGRLTFGGFMAFISGFWAAAGSLRALARKAADASRIEALAGRVAAYFQSAEALEPAGGRDHSRLAAVSFAHGDASVLSGLSLAVLKGERLLLRGRNGSGKSTLLNLLTGFLIPSEGEARLLSLDRVSACFAPQPLMPGTVGSNLREDALAVEKRGYLDALLAEFGIEGLLSRDVESLSSGQRRKVELVQALLKDADLYVFDEPLANVDADTKPAIMRRILERAEGRALVVVMHGDDDFSEEFDREVNLSEVKV